MQSITGTLEQIAFVRYGRRGENHVLNVLLLIGLAWAEPTIKGIPIEGIEGLSRPIYQTSTTGWWAQIPRGTVQVYVAPDEEEASNWVTAMRVKLEKYKPELHESFSQNTNTDVAYGDGVGLLIVRNGNVAFMVRHDGQAETWATTLHEATVPITDPMLPPASLTEDGGVWTVHHSEEVTHLSFRGGRTAQTPELQFIDPPKRLVIWDKWGRAVVNDLQTTTQREPSTPVP